jgi:hypothetical protein
VKKELSVKRESRTYLPRFVVAWLVFSLVLSVAAVVLRNSYLGIYAAIFIPLSLFYTELDVHDRKKKFKEATPHRLEVAERTSKHCEESAGLWFDGIHMLPGYYKATHVATEDLVKRGPIGQKRLAPRSYCAQDFAMQKHGLGQTTAYVWGTTNIETSVHGNPRYVPALEDEDGKIWAIPENEESEKTFPRRLGA